MPLEMRDILVVVGLFGWIAAVWMRLGRQKKRLLDRYGHDKPTEFLIAQAKQGDADARRWVRETWIFFAVAIIGGFFMAITK